jgi:putative Holliday junction resolvase
VDVGEVRIGVAMCDPDGMLATPLETVAAGPAACARIAGLVTEHAAIEIVLGLPISLSGREAHAARKARAFAQELAATDVAVPIRLVDERMSTMTATAQLRQSGRRSKDARSVVDQVAATVILQSALDSERAAGRPPGELLERET